MIAVILTVVISAGAYLVGEKEGMRIQEQKDQLSAELGQQQPVGIIWCDQMCPSEDRE